ncbi:MAG: ATP-grasp domain-containing protein [Bacteroidota bacterium]
MIIIDGPYISEFLLQTIRDKKFQIISTPAARQMITDDSLNWISEEDAVQIFKENPNTRIYTNSENSISWIENNFSFSDLPNKIRIFKNKIMFREMIVDSFPEYFYKGVKYSELRELNIDEYKFPFIIKPAVGFFSLAVYKVDDKNDWNKVLENIENEIDKVKGLYPKEVVNINDFIIEEYIDGDEYAIDCYFDDNGEPVILNILHHIFSSNKDVSDRVYTTSKKIIEELKNEIQEFLVTIGTQAGLKNFPAHIEVRINKGKVVPIEVNPLRFGGWCTTGDQSWYAWGINSYEYFFNNKKPNWEDIFRTRENNNYNIIVLDNNSGIDKNQIEYFDYDKLLSDFKNPLSLRKADYKKFPVFGFLFTETTPGNDKETHKILTSDLKKYIKTK